MTLDKGKSPKREGKMAKRVASEESYREHLKVLRKEVEKENRQNSRVACPGKTEETLGCNRDEAA